MHAKACVFYTLSLISHFVLQLYSYRFWKCEYQHSCWYILNSISAVNCQCQPTSGEYEPSNLVLDFRAILVQIQYVFHEFILCLTSFCVLLHMRWWAHCESGEVGSELLPFAPCCPFAWTCGAAHGSGHVSLCKAAVCNRHLQSEWKQPACFCILDDSRGGTDGIFFAGPHMSHAAFELIQIVCTPVL